tara:strand:+ start:1163 stop:1609 length:447 start_codon:yes stop_codon:yes gene_type:complete
LNVKKTFVLVFAITCAVIPKQSIAQESAKKDSVTNKSVARRALLRSLAIPGWGQLTNKRPIKGLGFATLSTSLLLYAVDGQASLSNAQSTTEHEDLTADRNTRILFFVLSNTLAAVDAYVDAYLADFSKNYAVDTQKNGVVIRFYKEF